MVIKDLYTYRLKGREENQIDATLAINLNHPLYLGHFPGFPVTPGVCQVLMVKEILENELDVNLLLTKARQIKFTAVHEPGSDAEIDASISFADAGDQLDVTARLNCEKKVFLKFKGEFRKHK